MILMGCFQNIKSHLYAQLSCYFNKNSIVLISKTPEIELVISDYAFAIN